MENVRQPKETAVVSEVVRRERPSTEWLMGLTGVLVLYKLTAKDSQPTQKAKATPCGLIQSVR